VYRLTKTWGEGMTMGGMDWQSTFQVVQFGFNEPLSQGPPKFLLLLVWPGGGRFYGFITQIWVVSALVCKEDPEPGRCKISVNSPSRSTFDGMSMWSKSTTLPGVLTQAKSELFSSLQVYKSARSQSWNSRSCRLCAVGSAAIISFHPT
jgi:hypothetical protein